MRTTNPLGNLCVTCRKPVPQPRTGRTRLYCNAACRQKRYRMRHGVYGRVRKKKPIPRIERRVDPAWFKPIHQPAPHVIVCRCMACHEVYVVERLHGGRLRKTCSKRCERQLREARKRFEAAMYKADVEGHLDDQVFFRHEAGKLSPLCPQCGQPFPPRYGPGRPKKYCSKQCCNAAYENRWRIAHGRKRRHRYRNCANCGKRIDREARRSGRLLKYCGKTCCVAAAGRAREKREMAALERERELARQERILRRQTRRGRVEAEE